MRRRELALIPALLAAPPRPAAAQPATSGDAELDAAVRRFAALPGETAWLLEAEGPRGRLAAAHRAEAPVFVGSALKSCILAAYLQEVEAGRLTLEEQLAVDDRLRSLVSPVFGHLTGTAPARVVLEAMIAHSDNTATDVALHRLGVEKVRALIAAAGMRDTRLTRSTRHMLSALAGAPPGTDLGWAGMLEVAQGRVRGPGLPPLNPHETMASTARDLVAWYRLALGGGFFRQAATLAEFKRIQAMATALRLVAPPDAMAYGKGGSIGWDGFQALAIAGQMVAGRVRATFCFAVNWAGGDETMPAAMEALRAPAAAALARVAEALA